MEINILQLSSIIIWYFACVPTWSFLTNHGRTLLCMAHDPDVRLREIASMLGITERRAYSIVNDLTEAGYVVKERNGRRNRYQVQTRLPLPETPNQEEGIGEVLDLLMGRSGVSGSNEGT
jgi:hypothetical protein